MQTRTEGNVNVIKGDMPDITLGQVLAGITWALSQAVAYGWIDRLTAQLTLSSASSFLAGVWIFVDAYLRKSRNQRRAAEALAAAGVVAQPTFRT